MRKAKKKAAQREKRAEKAAAAKKSMEEAPEEQGTTKITNEAEKPNVAKTVPKERAEEKEPPDPGQATGGLPDGL